MPLRGYDGQGRVLVGGEREEERKTGQALLSTNARRAATSSGVYLLHSDHFNFSERCLSAGKIKPWLLLLNE